MVQTRAQIKKSNEVEIAGKCFGYLENGERVSIEIKSKKGNCSFFGNMVRSNEFYVGQILTTNSSIKKRRFDSAILEDLLQTVYFGHNIGPTVIFRVR